MRRSRFFAGLVFVALVAGGCRSSHRTRRPRVAPPPEPTAEVEAPPPPPRPRPVEAPRPAPAPKPVERRPIDRSTCGPGGNGPRFVVHRVEASDTLNVRTSPDANSDVLGQIPPNATGVVGLGSPKKIGASTWRKVQCGQVIGWVNDRFLDPQSIAEPATRRL